VGTRIQKSIREISSADSALAGDASADADKLSPANNGASGRNRDRNRDKLGRFGPGNPGSSGGVLQRRVHALRLAVTDAVSPADIKDVMLALLRAAKAGDVPAAKEFLDRAIGKPRDMDAKALQIGIIAQMRQGMKSDGLAKHDGLMAIVQARLAGETETDVADEQHLQSTMNATDNLNRLYPPNPADEPHPHTDTSEDNAPTAVGG